MRLSLKTCEVRSWRASDLEPLVRHANSRRIWINLRDRFPHPCTKGDGQRFIRTMRSASPETSLAIVVGGEAAGGIGFVLQQDVDRASAEIGYWLGEPFWGRGITTEALVAVTGHVIGRHGVTRVFAVPFAHNTAS